MNNTEMKYRCVCKLCGPSYSVEDFIKNLFFANGVEVVQVTNDKKHAVVKMTDETAEALNGVLFQVA